MPKIWVGQTIPNGDKKMVSKHDGDGYLKTSLKKP